MSWIPGANTVDHRASFWYWQYTSGACWLLCETDGLMFCEGWDW